VTGQEIIDEVQVRLQESLSTTALQQSQLYPRHARRAADKVARNYHCLFATATTDLISGQVQYEIPKRPFRSESIRVNAGNGVTFPIDGLDFAAANSKFPNWTQSPPVWQGVPQFYVDSGGTTIYLVPVPNYGVQDGLLIDGYYGVDKWWDMEDDCPLPESYMDTGIVVLGAVIERCSEMLGTDPIYAAKKKDAEIDYDKLHRQLNRERIGRSEATRNAIPTRGKRLGAWSGWVVWGA
jgi:hypothetical protein